LAAHVTTDDVERRAENIVKHRKETTEQAQDGSAENTGLRKKNNNQAMERTSNLPNLVLRMRNDFNHRSKGGGQDDDF
jgi:hypothetical protein